ncbi:hypothetical protein ACFVMC_27035 [Nocardia sp. NPDC127579]|uniref:hypothetical protein n=1 Tax=Nocardia sp. NPDC127579 TaxID=3345402 RepID=UPI00362656D7
MSSDRLDRQARLGWAMGTVIIWAGYAVLFAVCALGFSGLTLLFEWPADGGEWGWLAGRGALFGALFVGATLFTKRRR